jgi:hypothetical protein
MNTMSNDSFSLEMTGCNTYLEFSVERKMPKEVNAKGGSLWLSGDSQYRETRCIMATRQGKN